jgi:mxaJ protein
MPKQFLVFTALAAALALTASPARAADFRVCADPDYLPFSNRAGQGFENKIAAYVAKTLGERLVYHYGDTRGTGGFGQFVQHTLDANRCDVLIDVPYGAPKVLSTDYYYVSSYVFVYLKRNKYDITSMDSPKLQSLRIGFEADTPAENGLKLRTLILHSVPFDTGDSPGESPSDMLEAVENQRIGVGVTWEPAVGMFLQQRPDLTAVPVPNSRSQGSPEQYSFPMAMAVRESDTARAALLNRVIALHKNELTAILARNGVKLYKPSEVANQ